MVSDNVGKACYDECYFSLAIECGHMLACLRRLDRYMCSTTSKIIQSITSARLSVLNIDCIHCLLLTRCVRPI